MAVYGFYFFLFTSSTCVSLYSSTRSLGKKKNKQGPWDAGIIMGKALAFCVTVLDYILATAHGLRTPSLTSSDPRQNRRSNLGQMYATLQDMLPSPLQMCPVSYIYFGEGILNNVQGLYLTLCSKINFGQVRGIVESGLVVPYLLYYLSSHVLAWYQVSSIKQSNSTFVHTLLPLPTTG